MNRHKHMRTADEEAKEASAQEPAPPEGPEVTPDADQAKKAAQ